MAKKELIPVKIPNYADRRAEGTTFSLSFTDAVRESEFSIVGCNFHNLRSDDAEFQLIERDDKKGFNVFMRNVIIVPQSFIVIKTAPKWMCKLIKLYCTTVGNG